MVPPRQTQSTETYWSYRSSEIGKVLRATRTHFEKEKTNGLWSVNASTLEEFTYKGIIQAEKVDDLKKVLKDPAEHFCLFVLSELGAQFVFLPRLG